MVAFFRANSSPTSHINNVIKATDEEGRSSQEDEEDDEDEDFVKPSRVRRQTRKNRKRSKDTNEDYGSWNPYTGISCNIFQMIFGDFQWVGLHSNWFTFNLICYSIVT